MMARMMVLLSGIRTATLFISTVTATEPGVFTGWGLMAKRLIAKGHQELLRYLEGDRVPQTRDRFTSGQRYYAAAARLWPLDTAIQARELFFRARVATFEHNYREAREWLNRALEFNEAAEYVHNALGIAILEDPDATAKTIELPRRLRQGVIMNAG